MNALIEFARTRGGLVTTGEAVALGISRWRLRALARSGVIARVRRGIYAVSACPIPHHDPRATVASMRVVLSHLSAAAWWGVDLVAPVPLLHVTAPRNRGRRADAVTGVRLHRAALSADDIVRVRGVRVTSPTRTCLDIARHQPLEHAVAIIDGFLRARLVRYDELMAALTRAQGPGRVRMQRVADLVDPRAGSVLESLTRVLLWRHGLRPEKSQFVMRHRSSGWRGIVDFAWPTHMLVLECDGYEFHADRQTFQKDRRRWSALTRLGWRGIVVTWFDVTADPGYVVGLVADTLGVPTPPLVQHTSVTSATAEVA